uniref:Protein tweety homolog n=2 Tax=Latimeria chalumnae TaxID=7897 RepID=H3AVU3_LATCH|nr:PREDICTED: protein tweety homolog 1 isoform X1 [Latimeria chalumnae]XP_014346674.1 PREDICTED: protein tweety homolog 1 isoform X1 [Latimeria chalumnae]|eukprot:XP_006000689.1 PREDICTED: protein tweety homolog 1 isoform X1 [Latimeria chalumnae]
MPQCSWELGSIQIPCLVVPTGRKGSKRGQKATRIQSNPVTMAYALSYKPSWWTLFLHEVPHVNFQFELVDNTFAPQDWNYQQALLFLASLSGFCLVISLILILVYLIRFCCCRSEEEEETKGRRECCVTWSSVAAVIICCAGIGIGFYGNSEVNDGVYQVSYSLMDTNLTFTSVDILISNTTDLLNTAVRDHLTRLEEIFTKRTEFIVAVRNTRRQAESVVLLLSNLSLWRDVSLAPLDLVVQLTFVEDYRWLAYILLLLLDLVICLFILLGLAKQVKWLLIVMMMMGTLALLLSWGSLGLETAAAVSLSDLCVDPNLYLMNQTDLLYNLDPDVLEYYLTCDPMVRNPYQQKLTKSQRALSVIHSQLHGLEREAIPQFPAAQKNLIAVQEILNITEGNFHHLVALLNCRGLNKDYTDTVKGLCYDGTEGLLFLFLFSLLSSLCFTAIVCTLPRAWRQFQYRDSEYDDIDEDDPFNPQARRQTPRSAGRPHLPSFYSYSSSCGSQSSLRVSAPPISNAPVSQYM